MQNRYLQAILLQQNPDPPTIKFHRPHVIKFPLVKQHKDPDINGPSNPLSVNPYSRPLNLLSQNNLLNLHILNVAINAGNIPKEEKILIKTQDRNNKNKVANLHKKHEQSSHQEIIQKKLQSLQTAIKILQKIV